MFGASRLLPMRGEEGGGGGGGGHFVKESLVFKILIGFRGSLSEKKALPAWSF